MLQEINWRNKRWNGVYHERNSWIGTRTRATGGKLWLCCLVTVCTFLLSSPGFAKPKLTPDGLGCIAPGCKIGADPTCSQLYCKALRAGCDGNYKSGKCKDIKDLHKIAMCSTIAKESCGKSLPRSWTINITESGNLFVLMAPEDDSVDIKAVLDAAVAAIAAIARSAQGGGRPALDPKTRLMPPPRIVLGGPTQLYQLSTVTDGYIALFPGLSVGDSLNDKVVHVEVRSTHAPYQQLGSISGRFTRTSANSFKVSTSDRLRLRKVPRASEVDLFLWSLDPLADSTGCSGCTNNPKLNQLKKGGEGGDGELCACDETEFFPDFDLFPSK